MTAPLVAYNKKVKKREKEKRKKARIEIRTSKKLLEEPEKLKKELDELTHKAIIGRIDPESLERKEKIEKLWDQYVKSKKVTEKESTGSPTEKSEETDSSDESDYSSDSDDRPKCVIEIKGELKKEPENKKRGFHDPDPQDEFDMEDKNKLPKTDKKETQEQETNDMEQKKFNYTPRPHDNMMCSNVPYTLNPPPPPPLLPPYPMGPNLINFMPQVPQPPPMMMNMVPNYQVMRQPITHQEVQEAEEKKEKVPLSKYFVPSQVRLNRKNPDNKSK